VLLVLHGANFSIRDNENHTALFHAIQHGQIHTVDFLLKNYSQHINLQERNIHCFSPLMCALWAMQPYMAIHLLVYYGDSIHIEECTNNAFKQTYDVIYSSKHIDRAREIKSLYANEITLGAVDN
jgi:ankyrin repeat protein